MRIRASLGVAQYDLPRTGFGTNISRGETFIGQTPDSISGLQFGLSVDVPLNDGKLQFGVRASDADGSDTAFVPAEGDDVGIVFDQGLNTPSSPTPITGVNLGPTGATVESDLSHEQIAAFARWYTPMGVGDAQTFIGLKFSHSETEHRSGYISQFISDLVGAEAKARLFDTVLGPEFGVETTVPISRTIEIEAGASASALFRQTDLENTFSFNCAFCPPEGQALQNRIDLSDNGWTAGLSAHLGMTYELTGGQKIGLRATADYLDQIGKVENQSSGDAILEGRGTSLSEDSALKIGVESSITF
ncbi:MAG: hypothetical protein AAF767_03280 [Pseudomonadota bacterium]